MPLLFTSLFRPPGFTPVPPPEPEGGVLLFSGIDELDPLRSRASRLEGGAGGFILLSPAEEEEP